MGLVIIVHGQHAPVTTVRDYAPGEHNGSPIRHDLPARQWLTASGSRWSGLREDGTPYVDPTSGCPDCGRTVDQPTCPRCGRRLYVEPEPYVATMTTTYTVHLGAERVHAGTDLGEAARVWDAATYGAGQPTPGGIAVATYAADGTMMRDGWIVHVQDNGVVYVNPSIAEPRR